MGLIVPLALSVVVALQLLELDCPVSVGPVSADFWGRKLQAAGR
jgi:hypothetical protein